MKRYPSKEAREIIALARTIGWREGGFSGSGHPVLIHENGSKVSIAATPGDRRNRANAIAMLEKLAGRKLETNSRRRAG